MDGTPKISEIRWKTTFSDRIAKTPELSFLVIAKGAENYGTESAYHKQNSK